MQRNQKIEDEGFFLPDLCSSRAVLMLVLVAELFVFVLVLALPGASGFNWTHLALTSLFVQWVVLSSAGIICVFRPYLVQLSLPAVAWCCLFIVAIITLTFTALGSWVLGYSSYSTIPNSSITIDRWLLLRNGIIAIIITGMLLRYFHIQHELLRQQQAELKARIQSLQSRIRPHFLFNSMNSIASLIHIDPDKAEQVVEDLSDLFRASLSTNTIEIPLYQELKLAHKYMSIEEFRIGSRLTLHWSAQDIPDNITIPHLTLQPLLENAVYHGIQPDTEGGIISLNAAYSSGGLTVTISNTLPDADTAAANLKTGNSIALTNIADRLQVLYGEAASLETRQYNAENRNWFEVTIRYNI